MGRVRSDNVTNIENSIASIKEMEGVESVILAEKVGLATEAFLAKDKDVSEISAMAASLWGLGEYYIRKLGRGILRCITVESDKSKVLTLPFKGKVLVVSAKKDVVTEDFKAKLLKILSKG